MDYKEQRVEFGGADPGPVQPGIIYVFEENGIPKMVDFLCPCGCGHTCPTHLLPPGETKKKGMPRWSFSRGPKGGVTLHPSIRWTGGCFAHFNIEDGKAVMHGDSGKKR